VIYTVYDDAPWLDIEYRLNKMEARGIESLYFTFPVGLDHPAFHYEAGGAVVEGEREQLPNACRDYYSVDVWADLSDATRGLTLATPDAPLVLWGGFTVGAYAERHTADRPLLISWAMNNKWHTNFRHSQPGEIRFRYRLWPHPSPFDRVQAERFGLTAALPILATPVVRGEGGALHPESTGSRPASQKLLAIDPDETRMVSLTRTGPEGATVILEPLRAVSNGTLAWGPGARITRAWVTDLSGHRVREATVQAGAVVWSGETGRWVALELELQSDR
jgi:hypothetical protein